ncbi:glycosyltransferase [Desulfitobacterium sp. THU1]|uniref:glycosyltransferase n=1 Tax=Desulfitobacterium sp. THU1 TaxID=3138072 RepID=UPI00311DAED2
MNVLVISHLYPTAVQPLSGIFVQQQIEAIHAQGVEVTLVNPTPWFPRALKGLGKWGKYAQVPDHELHQGMDIYHPRVLEFPRGYFFAHYPLTYRLGMGKLIARLVRDKKPDLIHAHVAHPDGAAAVALGKQYNLPVVVTIHGQDFAHTLNRSPRCAESVKDTLRQARRVVLVSDKLRENYGLELWADSLSKYRVIYNGAEFEDVDAKAQAEVQKSASCENAIHDEQRGPVLLTVGFLREPKGHAYVLEALANSQLLQDYPNLLYRIAGDGAERQNLEAQVRALGLEKHVEFLGSLPHPQAMAEMARCDIFVMPSWNEAFGVVYLEALSQGKPIIGTKGEGIAPLIHREEVGLTVRPRNAEDIRFAIEKLLGNPDLTQEMGKKGQILVRENFTWSHNAHQTIALYHEVLAEGNQGLGAELV